MRGAVGVICLAVALPATAAQPAKPTAKALEDALRFYADPASYQAPSDQSPVLVDGGRRARQALGLERDLLEVLGEPIQVCAGAFQSADVVAGGGRYLVSCTPERGAPQIVLLDRTGQLLARDETLLPTMANYSNVGLTYGGSGFQAIYTYACADNGSFARGWGWSCIEARQYAPDGKLLGPPVQFGQPGLNSHPVGAWSSRQDMAVAWVSYDTLYAARLDNQGRPGESFVLGANPAASDAREASRTRVVWDPKTKTWAVFMVIGGSLSVASFSGQGASAPLRILAEPAYADVADGHFDVVPTKRGYAVIYDSTDLELAEVTASGVTRRTLLKMPAQADYQPQPRALRLDDRIYVIADYPVQTQAWLLVLDARLEIVEQGPLAGATAMFRPAFTYDLDAASFAVVYLERPGGAVFFRRWRR